jgi:hypothetical protein
MQVLKFVRNSWQRVLRYSRSTTLQRMRSHKSSPLR